MIPSAMRDALDPTASPEAAADPFDGEVVLYSRAGPPTSPATDSGRCSLASIS